MPEYLYTDQRGHTASMIHKMTDDPEITCPECGEKMHRRPQLVAVNWNGIPPHLQTSRPPAIQAMIDNEQRNREHYEATKDTNPYNEFATKRSAPNG